MDRIPRFSVLLITALIACATQAQIIGAEREEALHARPAIDARETPARAGSAHEIFLYDYLPLALPVVDDFSVDRTRHLNAAGTDPGVTVVTTIYRLEVAGESTADMAFSLETTFRTTIDTVGVDTIYVEPLPSIAVTRYEMDQYPANGVLLDMWPPYSILDTVGDATSDTTFLTPQIVQDSLFVYQVPADTRTFLNVDNTQQPLILWEEDRAYVNNTFGVDPPTIGVASFDGLDRTGFPYSPDFPNLQDIADVLTSVPIDLTAFPADSVYLSFLYQPRGFSGDSETNATDSLRLEFYAPPPVNAWSLAWSIPYPGTAPQPFQQVLVPIISEDFLKNGFRMRFSNRGQLGGQVDLWHIDYVRLYAQRSNADTVLQDVAFTYPVNTLLTPYTSVPFNKFVQSPSAYMATNVDLQQKNLDIDDKFITWGFEVTDCGAGGSFDNYGNNISANASTTFNSAHPINAPPNNFTYDLSGCTDAAFPEAVFWTNASPDALVHNDSTRVVQELSNYYAYDDGSAESGYSLVNAQGGRIAYRFDTQGQDSLRALRMYFDPIFTYSNTPNDPQDGNFLIWVWSELESEPIFKNISFSAPEYRLWGPNYFVEYPLDSTIAVGGTFYVGWIQTNAVAMNLGIDKNRVNNDRMFYNVGNGWTQSQVQGSWMIRPVMVSTVDPFAGVAEQAVSAPMAIHPNPAATELWVRPSDVSAAMVEILDATGRTALRTEFREGAPIALSALSPGPYLVRTLNASGRTLEQQRLIVQR
jgi:hypothetical protein